MYCPLTTAASERASEPLTRRPRLGGPLIRKDSDDDDGRMWRDRNEGERGGDTAAGNVHSKQKKEAGSELHCSTSSPPPYLPRPLSDRVQESIRQKKRERRTRRPEADEPCSDGVRARQFWMHGVVRWVEVQPRQKKPLQTPARQRTSPVSLILLAAHWAVLSILSITRMNTNGDA